MTSGLLPCEIQQPTELDVVSLGVSVIIGRRLYDAYVVEMTDVAPPFCEVLTQWFVLF